MPVRSDDALGNRQVTVASDIAVVVTSHNYGRYLDACLESVRAQTLAPREVILVDDASDDDTAARARSYPDVGYHPVSFRNGNRARNLGFGECSSPFVVFFDADNVMEPRFLEALRAALSADPDAAFAYCDRTNFGEGDVSWYPQPMGVWRSRPFDPAALRRHNYIDLATLLRSDRFPGFDESLRRYQDWDLWLSVVLGGGEEGCYVSEPLFRYRVHERSVSRREDADEAIYRVRRKHALGAYFRVPVLRDSPQLFRALRRVKRWLRGLKIPGSQRPSGNSS